MAGSIPDLSAGRPPSSMASPRMPRSRTQSISSDRPSTIGNTLTSPPLTVSPQPAFIASSAASQIVTNDHDAHADSWYDESGVLPAGETALVSDEALQLVNRFLDQLLFNFLQVAKATTLSALRPAVTDVLKPKLAKDAINNADEELREYLGGGDEDDFVQPHGVDPSRDWDLELVWKRTRLRCMVYSSLGDMEEEEEDNYMEQEHLEIGADEQITDVISPAVAIFLTSVLEYMGELTLTVAGQAAYHRLRTSYEKELREGSQTPADIADRVVVRESDMERVALDRTLGRLWRGWKKRIRTPGSPSILDMGPRPFSRTSASGHLRQGSNVTDIISPKPAVSEAGSESRNDAATAAGEATLAEGPEAFEVPLPISDNDVNEIEVPGLVSYSDDEDDVEDDDTPALRPKSFVGPFALIDGEGHRLATFQSIGHRRSASLPTTRSRFIIPPQPVDEALEEGTDDDKEMFEEALSEQPPKAADEATAETAEGVATNGHPRDVPEVALASEAEDDEPGQDVSDPEDADDSAYEKAQVMTSSRVSVASSSPSSSEGLHKEPSSARSSARIVDVPAPRGHGSRTSSVDTTDRSHRRSVSLSRAIPHAASPPPSDEFRKSRAGEVRSGAVSPLQSHPDRPRPSLQNASISESDEEKGDTVEAPNPAPVPAPIPQAPTYASPAETPSTAFRNRRANNALGLPRSSSAPMNHQYGPSNTKVTILTTSSSAGPFIDEAIPENPVSPVLESTERHKARDSEEGPLFPIQSNASQRPTHTSGSSSSSTTGRMKALRTSEEQNASRAEHVARNFEELIQSNQTITYTLTPENMRDMDASAPRSAESPSVSRFSRPKGDEAKVEDRSRSSSVATDAKGSSRVVGVAPPSPSANSTKKPSPIIAPPHPRSPSSKSPHKSTGSRAQAQTSISPTGPKSPRMPAALARDARVPTDSTADFAEFIKSTGPAGDTQPPPFRSANSVSGTMKTSTDSRRVSVASTTRNRYQPREATIDAKGDNSDLIDFIRQGPPGSSNGHRIPRHVAPFRSTMDSETMFGASGGRAVDATVPEMRNSHASTSFTENSGPSLQSSANSHSALLKNKTQGAQQNAMFGEDDMVPKRKQRRVRDPYAIDFSDEEDDELLRGPKLPVTKEESLAEFLRNYQPPPQPQEQPISQKIPKKKSSAPSLMGRFTRGGFGSKEPKTSNTAAAAKPALETRSVNSRAGTFTSTRSGHVPIQVNMPPGYDRYGPVENAPVRPRGVSSTASAGRVPMKKFEPREATPGMTRTGTSDLAAFLRDSEPPPSTVAHPLREPVDQESRGFSRMLARARKPIF